MLLNGGKEVLVTVGPDGEAKLDFNGFVGKACLLEADKLRAALATFGISFNDEAVELKPEATLAGELLGESETNPAMTTALIITTLPQSQSGE